MSQGDTKRVNIFKRFWRATGGGAMTALYVSLALICLVLFVFIAIYSSVNAASIEEVDEMNEALQIQQGLEDENVDNEGEDEGWIDGLDTDDTTNIGNKINTSQLPDSSFIYEVSIEELANADSYLDGQTVQVTGEVVGDRITAESNPKYCWITLQSQDADDSEVSVYMSKTASKAIDTFGSYGKEGTTLQVRGIFYLASEDHQGASEIRAESVSAVTPGEVLEDAGNPKSLEAGLVFIFIGSCLMILFNIMRERQR